jgi:predicted NBD/HSP70 family sugar kinase
VTIGTGGVLAARPQLIRAMNEQTMLAQVRRDGPISRADLARKSGLSKPTVGLALANLERDGLVQVAGLRTGMRGPAAVLYEVRPEAGFVLALDVGGEYLRGEVADLAGAVRSKGSRRVRASSGHNRVAQLTSLGDTLIEEAALSRADVTQTVVGSPGYYDPSRGAMTLARSLPGWERPHVLSDIREAYGLQTIFENDVDLAAVAEHAHGHGRGAHSMAFVSIGTGVGMGLVIDGQLHRGSHGAAGEIGYLPLGEGEGLDARDARRRGQLEASVSAAGVVRAARRRGGKVAGKGPPTALTARRVFAAAAAGEPWAVSVVATEAVIVAKAIASVIAVVDPELIVLGGGIGRAPGFADAVAGQLRSLSPVVPELRVTALGDDVILRGCLAAGIERAWERVLDRP